MIKRLLRDSVAYFISKSIVGLLGVLTLFFVLKFYGSESYAEFSMLLLIATTVSNFSSTWLSQSYLRLSHEYEEHAVIVKEFLLFSVLLSLPIVCVVLFVTDNSHSISLTYLLTASLSAYSVGRACLQKQRKIRLFVLLDAARAGFILIAIFLFFYLFSNKLEFIVFSFIIGNSVFLYSIFKTSDFYFLVNGFESNIKVLFKWFSFGFPVALWLTVASLQLYIDRYLINNYIGLSDGGYYSAFYDMISRTCALIIIPISNAIYPLLVKNEKNNNYGVFLTYTVSSTTFFCAILSLLFFLVYPLFSNYFITGLNRAELATLFSGILLWQFGIIYHKPLEMKNKTISMLINLIVCVFISFLINYNLISQMGIKIFPYTCLGSAVLYMILTCATACYSSDTSNGND